MADLPINAGEPLNTDTPTLPETPVNETQPSDEPLLPPTSPTQVPMPEATATDRAMKANFALGQNSPGFEVIKNNLLTGSEDAIREAACGRR